MGFFTKNKEQKISWKQLNQIEQLSEFVELSKQKPIAIFKHSTRCSLSSMAMSRLERGWELTEEDIDMYYLDLLSFREISNEIAFTFSIEHQSPQLILISNGKIVFHVSHGEVSAEILKSNIGL